VPNPFNPKQITRISLAPEDVDVIVFWTKNAKPILKYLTELNKEGYKYYFQYTLNNYPASIEPNKPEFSKKIETFKMLSGIIGPEKVIWRYDPIILSNITPPEYHTVKFREIIQHLSGYTKRVVVSILDDYRAAKSRLYALKSNEIMIETDPLMISGKNDFLAEIALLAASHGLEIFSCAEKFDLSKFNIKPGKCIDDDLIRKLFGGLAVNSKKDKNQRAECGCVISKDIGMYDSCPFDCKYCYATHYKKKNHDDTMKHFDDSPSLLGRFEAPHELSLFDISEDANGKK
jgi:hypothetical protein